MHGMGRKEASVVGNALGGIECRAKEKEVPFEVSLTLAMSNITELEKP